MGPGKALCFDFFQKLKKKVLDRIKSWCAFQKKAEADSGAVASSKKKQTAAPQSKSKNTDAASQHTEGEKPTGFMRRSASPRMSTTSPRRFVHQCT